MFFDVLERDGLHGTPTLLAATGGTARHSLALDHAMRPLFAYLGAATVPTAVFAASEDWGAGEAGPRDRLAERIARAATELAIWMARHEPAAPSDPFSAPIPFERLLRGEG
jgi:FMN reductase